TLTQAKFVIWLLKVEESWISNITKDIANIQLFNNIVLFSKRLNDLIHFAYSEFTPNTNSYYFVE
ncbi:12877_t:CDS:1, partial [Cetraspora pellucida]